MTLIDYETLTLAGFLAAFVLPLDCFSDCCCSSCLYMWSGRSFLLPVLDPDVKIALFFCFLNGLVLLLEGLSHSCAVPPACVGGLVEPPVVPRFLAGLSAAGAQPTRVESYQTTAALAGPHECEAERQLLEEGHVDAIAFSSQAEVRGPQSKVVCRMAWSQCRRETFLKLCRTA